MRIKNIQAFSEKKTDVDFYPATSLVLEKQGLAGTAELHKSSVLDEMREAGEAQGNAEKNEPVQELMRLELKQHTGIKNREGGVKCTALQQRKHAPCLGSVRRTRARSRDLLLPSTTLRP